MATGTTEQIRNVTFEAGHVRSLDKVLANSSSLVRVSNDALPTSIPVPSDEGVSDDDLRKPPFSSASDPRSVGVAPADYGNDGGTLTANDFRGPAREDAKEGIYALEKADTFNILCIPPYAGVNAALIETAGVDKDVITDAVSYCERRRAFLIVDPDPNWQDKEAAKTGVDQVGTRSKNAALFFPRLRQPNPLRANQIESFAPCRCAHAVLTARRSTILGRVDVQACELAENSLFVGPLLVARRQRGCVRFCYVAPGSRTPRRYHCQPDEVVAGRTEDERRREEARVRPRFDSIRYGTPTYCRLAPSTAPEIVRGADDRSEMGVVHHLYHSQRTAALQARLDEYTPAGMEAGLIDAIEPAPSRSRR